MKNVFIIGNFVCKFVYHSFSKPTKYRTIYTDPELVFILMQFTKLSTWEKREHD